jgi:hypothetical protein
MQHRKSKELRYMLAQVGIKLDDEKPEVGPKAELREDPDRERTMERIREIVIAVGAPDRDRVVLGTPHHDTFDDGLPAVGRKFFITHF